MSAQVRDGVFETNSSSSHSVTVANGDVFDLNFSPDTLRSGVIKLSPPLIEGEDEFHFDDTWRRFYKPEHVLTYLLVIAADGRIDTGRAGVDLIPALSFNHKRFRADVGEMSSRARKRVRNLLAWVKDETGCRIEFSFPDTGADRYALTIFGNQSSELAYLLKKHDALKSLLFNSGSYVETGYDNEQAPYLIWTDLGEKRYYENRFRQRDDLADWFSIELEGNKLVFEDTAGEIEPVRFIKGFDLYHLARFDTRRQLPNFHLDAFRMTLPVYVSDWPEGMEEHDTDLLVSNETRALDLMNSFTSLVLWLNNRGTDTSSVTFRPDIVPELIEEGTSSQVARMPHECTCFFARVVCDERTRMMVRNNVEALAAYDPDRKAA